METKHTPGPWETTPGLTKVTALGGNLIIASGIEGKMEEKRFEEQSIANAKLIAAAPELLMMCESAFNLCNKRAMPTESEINLLKEMLNKVIKKATT